MINGFYRFLFCLIGLSPMSIGFLCRKADSFCDVIMGVLFGVAVCIVAMFLFSLWRGKVLREIASIELAPVAVKKQKSGPTGYFFAYILPLLLATTGSDWLLIAIVALMLLASLKAHEIETNPVVELMGYRFYEVDLRSGITISVLSRAPIQAINSTLRTVQVSDVFFIHVDKEK